MKEKLIQKMGKNFLLSQFELEDLAKEELYYSKNKSEKEQKQKMFNLSKIIEKRKNLYIFPEQANV